MADLMGVLSGLRIIELSAFVAVPLGGATLASMGADVIRVDPLAGALDQRRLPTVGERSLYWAGLNQGKRSVALDLGSKRGQALVHTLLRESGENGGVVITNLPTGGWSSYERLRDSRSDLIMVVLAGNPDGSQAVDYTVNARLGFPYITGPAHLTEPVNHSLPAWDAQAGYLIAIAVLAAERHRLQTGEGQLVRLNLMDVGLALTARLGLLAEAELVSEPRGRHGNYVYGTFGRDFTTREGRRLMVVALTPRQWRAVVEATGLASSVSRLAERRQLDLSRERARWEAREEIAGLLSEWTSARDLDEIAQRFEAAGVVWAPYQTFKQLLTEDPGASPANPTLVRVSDPGTGDYLLPRSPLHFSAFGLAAVTPPPWCGQHTEEVLRELGGLTQSELASLAAEGVIATRAAASGSGDQAANPPS